MLPNTPKYTLELPNISYSYGKKDTDPYNTSPIEMRSLWIEMKYI